MLPLARTGRVAADAGLLLLLLLLLLSLVPGARAQEEPRWALVVGNNAYRHVGRLQTAVNDARAMAATLGRLGFTVLAHEDLDRRGMNRAVGEFADRVAGGVGIVYFAGHGVQLRSGNYLLPVDVEARDERDVEDDAVALDRLLALLAGARAKLLVVFLDACRNNPLPPGPQGRSLGATRGLGQPASTPNGVMVVYSAGANEQALDRLGDNDRSPNGLFARELLPELERPGVAIDDAVKAARERVRRQARAVGHQQNPAIYDQLEGGVFYLRAAEPALPAPDPRAADAAFWAEVRESRDPADLDAYLEQFPSGLYARLARNRKAALEAERRQQTAAAVRPPPPPALPRAEVDALRRKEFARRAQVALAALGRWTEPPTGALSQEAEAAIYAFMRQSKLDGEALSEAVVGSLEREVVEREEEKRRRVAQDVTKPVLEVNGRAPYDRPRPLDWRVVKGEGQPDAVAVIIGIADYLRRYQPREVTMFADACFSGRVRDGANLIKGAKLLSVEVVPPDVDAAVLTSSGGKEISVSLDEVRQGAFSYVLMRGLEGEADRDGDKRITLAELHAWTAEQLPRLAETPGGPQRPAYNGVAPDRILVRLK